MATPEQFLEVVTNRYMALQDAINSQYGADNAIGLVPDRGAAPDDYVLSAAGLWVPQSSISPGSVTNADLADMAQSTIKGRAAGAGTGSPQDLTATQATAILDAFTGDSGSGGVKGLVPAPSSGDAAANKFLNADGTFKATNQGLTLLTSGTVSSAATLDLVLSSYSAYRSLTLKLIGFIPVTDDVGLLFRVSTDGGSTFASTGYLTGALRARSSGTVVGFTGTTAFSLTPTGGTIGCSNAAQENGWNGDIEIFDFTNTGIWPTMKAHGTWVGGGSGEQEGMSGAAVYTTAQDTDAIRLIFSSGNISSGKYALYGWN